jgi:ATP-dependent Clp protease ATP-binding subunit ClpB
VDIERLTHKSQEALQRAAGTATDRSHPEVGTAHLLSALLEQSDGVVLPLLNQLGVTPATLRARTHELLDATSAAYGASGNPTVAQPLRRVLDAAEEEMTQLGDSYVSTEHLLLALVEAGDRTSEGADRAGRHT